MRGAEAVLSRTKLLGRDCVVKDRMPKAYRLREIDSRLRSGRTRGEARLLHRAKLAGVLCPVVLEIRDYSVTMTFIGGKRPGMDRKQAHEAGSILARLHGADIIHGDYTPANLIAGKGHLAVIDFGLGFISGDVEDKAVDLFTMLRALEKDAKRKAFIEGYTAYEKAESVLARVKNVEKRVRYAF